MREHNVASMFADTKYSQPITCVIASVTAKSGLVEAVWDTECKWAS